jgi:hypothetical protein
MLQSLPNLVDVTCHTYKLTDTLVYPERVLLPSLRFLDMSGTQPIEEFFENIMLPSLEGFRITVSEVQSQGG